ncbi:hypothetical protein CSIM01_00604 [Colletotrichum simmondsii]|uniref:Uncharacterized protein n=1 Tax=Colletotrichum simmondsii TaxID=703756 RepID=A0A135SIZ6_9PEZI|nr:hypothetical protein CSIM01_00604 [Colletotrichum simmondsii]
MQHDLLHQWSGRTRRTDSLDIKETLEERSRSHLIQLFFSSMLRNFIEDALCEKPYSRLYMYELTRNDIRDYTLYRFASRMEDSTHKCHSRFANVRSSKRSQRTKPPSSYGSIFTKTSASHHSVTPNPPYLSSFLCDPGHLASKYLTEERSSTSTHIANEPLATRQQPNHTRNSAVLNPETEILLPSPTRIPGTIEKPSFVNGRLIHKAYAAQVRGMTIHHPPPITPAREADDGANPSPPLESEPAFSSPGSQRRNLNPFLS